MAVVYLACWAAYPAVPQDSSWQFAAVGWAISPLAVVAAVAVVAAASSVAAAVGEPAGK